MNKLIYLLFFVTLSYTISSCRSSKKKKHSYMEATYATLKDSFPDAELTILSDSIKMIFPDNIMFNTNESVIMNSFLVRLNRLSVVMNKYDKTDILITGHTDNIGQESYNLKLSKERAQNVKDKMVENNVRSERMLTWGLGQKSPITENTTEEGRARNRRVEFVILFNAK